MPKNVLSPYNHHPELTEDNEIMPLPEISIHEETGITQLSILLKMHDPSWGKNLHDLPEAIKTFFVSVGTSGLDLDYFDSVDEETLYNIALIYEHPERETAVYDFIKKHKPNINDPHIIKDRLMAAFKILADLTPNTISQLLSEGITDDIEKRRQNLTETKKQLSLLIEFFKPLATTTAIRKISLLPTDPLSKKDTGSAYTLGDELIIKSHIDNPDNLSHEFLHSIINPIVDNLATKLTAEQKQKISDLANRKLKHEYGDNYYSLLCEEFIRTYNDQICQSTKPLNFDDFSGIIDGLDETRFKELFQNNQNFQRHCASLGIGTLQDLMAKKHEYFEAYEKNELRQLIYGFYQEFIKQKETHPNTTFENFILNNFTRFIDDIQP